MIRKILQSMCDHKGTALALKTVSYNTENVTATGILNSIICSSCGKTIIYNYQFDDLKELLNANLQN